MPRLVGRDHADAASASAISNRAGQAEQRSPILPHAVMLAILSRMRCPCSSGLPYDECCGPIHEGAAAPTAERLMRSRYSAFALGEADYLLASWHPSTRPATIELNTGQQWLSLEILGRTGGGMFDTEGTVDFRARYRFAGDRYEQVENSRFVRVEKRWVYLSPVA